MLCYKWSPLHTLDGRTREKKDQKDSQPTPNQGER
jgi:hypothetical protein